MDRRLQKQESGILIFPRHAYRCGFCAKGQRLLFARLNWNYLDYVKNGLPLEIAKEAKDFLVDKVIAKALAEYGL